MTKAALVAFVFMVLCVALVEAGKFRGHNTKLFKLRGHNTKLLTS